MLMRCYFHIAKQIKKQNNNNMASSCSSSSSSSSAGSPCGACKFLRRKCIRGCIFAPYFCHEQGPAQFGAIHKVFGASNVSKILTQLPVSERAEAAITISYEAQARLQDPIYGCVSHIFALQQQVVNLQTQLACLKEQAAQTICTASITSANPNLQFFPCIPQDPNLQNWPSNLQESDDLNTLNTNVPCNNTINEISMVSEENCNISSSCHGYDQDLASHTILYSSPNIQARDGEWSSEDANDLHSIAFGYSRHS